jgi:hypothetical protein
MKGDVPPDWLAANKNPGGPTDLIVLRLDTFRFARPAFCAR